MTVLDVRSKQVPKCCPECNSSRIDRAGLRYLADGSAVQRYLCRDCGFRFSENSYKMSETNKGSSQICAKKMVKNLEPQTESKAVAGDRKTALDKQALKGKLLEFEFWLNKQGYDVKGSKNRAYLMKRLSNLGAVLTDPETIKKVLAEQKTWNDGYKMLIVYAYESFIKMEGLKWLRPKYRQPDAFPFIPTNEEEIQLISALGQKVGTFCQGLYDTGANPGELVKAQWIDINVESRTTQIRPVKGHNPRVLPISEQFLNRLARFPKTSQRIFNINSLKSCFYPQRKKAARKFANPRLLKISFTTFRHFKGTMEYHRTKDILYVKKLLGHKRIENTLKYIDLEAMIFKPTNEEFFTKVASNVQEACELIESGFEYVTGEYMDGGKIFRKRK